MDKSSFPEAADLWDTNYILPTKLLNLRKNSAETAQALNCISSPSQIQRFVIVFLDMHFHRVAIDEFCVFLLKIFNLRIIRGMKFNLCLAIFT